MKLKRKMKTPEWWHWYRHLCELYEMGMSNMIPRSKQDYCWRGQTKSKSLPEKKCSFHVCPKFKNLRKKIKEGNERALEIYNHNTHIDEDEIKKYENKLNV